MYNLDLILYFYLKTFSFLLMFLYAFLKSAYIKVLKLIEI